MKFTWIILTVILCAQCITPPDFPDEPVIKYTGMSKQSMKQGNSVQDSIKIFFSFTDGDGDLGVPSTKYATTTFDLTVIDKRTNLIQENFYLPHIPPKGTGNGIQGTAEVLILTTCCIFEDNTPPCETSSDTPTNSLQYEIFIRDRAGHESNHITTDEITLLCE